MKQFWPLKDHMIKKAFIYVICIFFTATPSFGLEIVKGKAIQGGLLIVKTEEGHEIMLDEKPLMVSKDGYAAFGFHRDDVEEITLRSLKNNEVLSTLTIEPEAREYKEQRINGLPKKMVTPPQQVLDRIKNDREIVGAARAYKTPIEAFLGAFEWPSYGIITGVYGSRRILNNQPRAPHYGIDIAAPKGTPVKAPQAGIIRMVEDLYYTGWTIILDHGHGVSSTFLHLENTSVKIGEHVEKGDLIGTVGSTGRSTGPHLDWRVNWFGKRLDPALLVGPMPQ